MTIKSTELSARGQAPGVGGQDSAFSHARFRRFLKCPGCLADLVLEHVEGTAGLLVGYPVRTGVGQVPCPGDSPGLGDDDGREEDFQQVSERQICFFSYG